jgi:hypothetical protein
MRTSGPGKSGMTHFHATEPFPHRAGKVSNFPASPRVQMLKANEPYLTLASGAIRFASEIH